MDLSSRIVDARMMDPSRQGRTVTLSELNESSRMTPQVLAAGCKRNQGYATPELNDQLFLNYRGFQKIENLEPYVGILSNAFLGSMRARWSGL